MCKITFSLTIFPPHQTNTSEFIKKYIKKKNPQQKQKVLLSLHTFLAQEIDRYIEIIQKNLSWARSDLGLTWIVLQGCLSPVTLYIPTFDRARCVSNLPKNSTRAFFSNWACTHLFFKKSLFLTSQPNYTFITLKQHN